MLVSMSLLCKGCHRMSIISAYLCEQAQKIQIRYVWTRISDTLEQDLIAFKLKNNKKNFQRENATAYASRANESTLENIIRYLPALGFPEGVEQ